MKTSEIKFLIELDDNNIPEKIFWDATQKGKTGLEETKAFCLALWDENQNNTLKIDLWSKDMPVDTMKRFYIEAIGGMAQSLMTATGDETMVSEMNELCERLGKYLEKQTTNQK